MPSILETVAPEVNGALLDAAKRLEGAPPAADTWQHLLDAAGGIDGPAFIADLLEASRDPEVLDRLVEGFDEKEGCMRIRLGGSPHLSARLHAWTPPPPGGEPFLDNVPGHPGYLVSTLVAGAYTSDDYHHADREGAGNALVFTGRRILGRGSVYVIAPETVHAVANPFAEHCVSLILRGGTVTDRILIFDRDSGRATGYQGVRPVGDIGRTPAEAAMPPRQYLRYRVDRIRAALTGARLASQPPGAILAVESTYKEPYR